MGMKKKHVDLSMICYYLKSGKYPDGITDSDKRSIRKRSKDFRLKNGDMYFVCEGESENGEDSSEIVGRKVLLQPDPIRKAFLECHVDDEGNHRSYDKTVKQFSDLYYLSQTIETVRSYIKDCPVCQAYRTGNNQLTPACKTPSERAEHVEELMAALPFTENVGEVITQFWQKVEVDLLGPYKTNGGNLVYVVICLDSYSLWPEAKIVEYVDDGLPMVEILLFILSLIARYGVMHSLMFRKDSFMHNDIKNQFDLLTDEENTLNIEFGRCQHTDEIWKDLESGIVKFTKKYVKDWSKCIELCLMPYRISRAELAEYTPAFLVHNREPRLPSSISYRQPNSDLDPNLSDAQMRDIQSQLMKISKILPEVYVTPNSPVKSSSLNDDSSPVLYYSPDEGETETPVITRAKTKNAASNKLTYSKVDNKNSTPVTSATSSKKNTPIIVTSSASMRSKKSVTNSVERSSGSQQDRGATCTPSPRKQAQQIENAEMEIDEMDDEKGSVRKKRENRDVPLEEYYSALKLYIQHKQYPPGINDDYKRTIRKTAQNYVIEKDGLYYKSGTKLKKTVTDELERFKLLKQAHVLEDGTHLERFRTVARLKDYYWKGMTVDALALVKTCPVCELSNERRKSETNRCPAQESFLNLIKEAEAEPVQLSEAAQSRLYECLRLFLINGYKKKNYMSPEEIEYVEKESANYKVSADGLLYHIMYEGIGGLRKVITTSAEKQKILTEIHILRTGIHRGVERTKSILQGSYYWVGINRDLKEFLEKCCLARVFPEKEKTPKSQEDKLAKFAEYFQMDLNQLNTQETSTPLNDRQPENILTSVGLKEKTPSAEKKNNSSTAADNPGNQDAMEVALVEAAQAAEAHVAVPATEGDAAVSATEANAAVPATEGDATIPVTGDDVAIPTTEGDVAIPITEAHIAVLATESDVATVATETHVAIPTIEGDVVVPVTEADMTIPAIEGNVAIPVTETHVTTEGDVTIPVTEGDVALSTSCLETADITDIATTISITASTTTTATDESTDPTNVLTSLSDAITVTSTSNEISTANVISESEAAALTDGQAVDSIENSEVDAADKVVKTYSEVACNTEDSDAIDDLDDSDEEEGQIVTPKSISSNSTNADSVSSTPLKLVRSVPHRLPAKRLNNQLKRVSNGNNLDEVQSAVNNLKSEVDDIDIPDDFATLASMIQRRQTISAGESTEIPIPTEVFSPTISIKRGYEEMEDGELEEVEIIKGECVSLNSSLDETNTSKGLRKIKGKQGKRKKQIPCNVCGSMFGGQVALQIHMSTHSGVKPFSCEVCGKRFTERKYVRIHMRRHTGEKPYLCSICGKGFSRTQSLQSHILSHEKGAEDGLQKCGLCHRPFASESRLQAHMESKHPAVPKVYKCAECSRVFTAMRSLKRHIEAHMGLKRYECQHCGRRFLRKEYLRSHATQHTDQVMPAPKRKKPNMPCPQLKITVGSNTYSVFTSDSSAVPQEDQETWVAAELVQDEEQIQDPNETARATESVEQSVEAPLFFIAPNQVEYEVECTSSGGTELTEADLTAINILAQATLNTPTALPLT